MRVVLSLGYGAACAPARWFGSRSSTSTAPRDHPDRAGQRPQGPERHAVARVLELLREWWKARTKGKDAGVAPEERWLFPGFKPGRPMTTRQLTRRFHETAERPASGRR